VAVSLFRTGSASATEQLRRLREQAETLMKERVEPAVADAAATVAKAQPLRQVLDLLPLAAEYGGLASQMFRRVKGQAEEAVAPALRHRAARHWSAPLRPVAVAVIVLGVGYVTYRLAVVSGRTPAPRTPVRRSRSRQRSY
jgi:hypothetical protein